MSDNLLTEGVWDHLTRAVRDHPKQCHVAVAYFNSGAAKLLPLEEGSLLVVNMSENAVKSGLTDPGEILKLLNRGVGINSVENLHAKVVVAKNVAFVGSTNASRSSAERLTEAALRTTRAGAVGECREFVRGLAGEVVTPEYARRMKKLYRPPRGVFAGQRSKSPEPKHQPLWLVPLVYSDWDAEDERQGKIGLPKAKEKMRSSTRFRVEQFHWQGLDLLQGLEADHLLMQFMDEGKQTMVSPAARVVHVRRYMKGTRHNAVVFLEVPKQASRKDLAKIVSRLGPRARDEFGKLEAARLLRDEALAHSLLNLWVPTAE